MDFQSPGAFSIRGTVQNEQYQFPLACGFGDPVIFPWEGRYYFIATNDNLNDVGFYVRESEDVGRTVPGGNAAASDTGPG